MQDKNGINLARFSRDMLGTHVQYESTDHAYAFCILSFFLILAAMLIRILQRKEEEEDLRAVLSEVIKHFRIGRTVVVRVHARTF